MDLLARPLRLLLDALWPPLCPLCGRTGDPALCEGCRLRVPVLPEDAREVALPGKGAKAFVLAPYLDPQRALLLAWKYGRDTAVGAGLSLLFADLGEDLARGLRPDLVVPVPMGRRRRRERGFNQAAVLARRLALRIGVEAEDGLLVRGRATPPQVGLGADARLRNLRGAFGARGVFGRAVLLIDDVVTTGATLLACREALLLAGARRVAALALLHAPPPGG